MTDRTPDLTPEQAALVDAMHELARLRAQVETLKEENRVLRLANKSLSKPWASREGETE